LFEALKKNHCTLSAEHQTADKVSRVEYLATKYLDISTALQIGAEKKKG